MISAANAPSVQLLWFADCPNHEAARDMLIDLVAIHAPGAAIRLVDATDPAIASALRRAVELRGGSAS